MPPLEELATLLTTVLTMASSSAFVRSHVDPEGYAKAKAKEAYKKEKQLESAGVEIAVKKILTTPPEELDIARAMETIEKAEQENVLSSLIDKAAERVERAIEIYMSR